MPDLVKAFKKRISTAIANPTLQTALDNNAMRRKAGMQTAFQSAPNPRSDLRKAARRIRWDVVENLNLYLNQLIANLRANGIQVHRTTSATEATALVVKLCQQHKAKLVAKSKSMISEEIHLNAALETSGIDVVETDLGEYIIQLRQETPAHIITPAVHLRREDVGQTFHELLGVPYTTDVAEMNETARKKLRQVFLTADVGISGVNFAVVEDGTLCLLTNEGNGRMVTTLPPVHIALLGAERILPTHADLDIMLQLLPRSATGQKLTTYVTMLQAARQNGDNDGPQERHVIIVDNGRLSLAESNLAETLLCIRCGACLNACPVFQEAGGHAYGSPYPGPIGSLVSPGLLGITRYGHLAKASTLCGACMDACPVEVNFPKLLLEVRQQYTVAAPQPLIWRAGMRIFAWAASRPAIYRMAMYVLGWLFLPWHSRNLWLQTLPGLLAGWTNKRDFPPFARSSFRSRLKKLQAESQTKPTSITSYPRTQPLPIAQSPQNPSHENADLARQCADEVRALGGEWIPTDREKLTAAILGVLRNTNLKSMIASDPEIDSIAPGLLRDLAASGIAILNPKLMLRNAARKEGLNWLSQAQAGLTTVEAAIADTGTLVLNGGAPASQLASLLPPVHLAIVRPGQLTASYANWLKSRPTPLSRQSTLLISGPSRTADIEMTLTIGVHGPRRVIVFYVAD